MSTYKYSPVDPPSTPSGTEEVRARLLIVAPLFHFLTDPWIRIVPTSVVACVVAAAAKWRRFMAHRPQVCHHQCWRNNDVSVAHILLSLPLLGWLIQASVLAILRPTSHRALQESGFMASHAMTAVFFTANKSNSLLSLVTGLSFDRLVRFHLASALLALWMGGLHGIQIAYYHGGQDEDHHDDHDHHHGHDEEGEHDHRMLHHDSIHAYLGPDPNLWDFLLDGKRNTTGSVVYTALTLLVATSVFHGVLRKWWFELWLFYHVVGASVILVVGILHFKMKHGAVFLFVILWWILDLLIRYGMMAGIRYPHKATVTRVAENLTKIQFDTNGWFQYEAGQFVQLAIPSVHLWEFHPFSIASSPDDPQVTLYVRALPGAKTWTRKLYELAAPSEDSESKVGAKTVRIYLEGPYGSVPPIVDRPDRYSMAILISGGIGVTPCHSIATYLIADCQSHAQPVLKKLLCVWIVRDEGMIQAIPPPTWKDGGVESTANDETGVEMVQSGKHGQLWGQSTDDDKTTDDDVLIVISEPRSLILQNEIYVTQTTQFLDDEPNTDKEESADKGNIASIAKDSVEETDSSTIHRGKRPDVSAIISEIRTEALREGWGRVFVMGCGPVSLLEELQVACQRNQTKEVQIDYHEEVFDY